MDKIDLAAQLRSKEVSVQAIRRQGSIPAVVYGKGEDSLALTVSLKDFQRVYKMAGETTIINLQIAGRAPKMTLIKDIQLSPDTDAYLHADFYQIKVGEKLRVAVPLKFVGEAPAVKNFGGIVITNKNEVEVECLPPDLPHEITVDLTGLVNIDDAVLVGDLPIGTGVTVLDNPEESIVVVTPPAAEEIEEVPVSEAEAVAAVETTEEKAETSGEETTLAAEKKSE